MLLAAAAVVAGIVPAMGVTGLDPVVLLKAGGPTSTGAGSFRRTQALLVAGQVAIALVVLSSTVVLVRASSALARVDPMFDTASLLTMRVSLPSQRYDGERSVQFFDAALERLRTAPGVTQATAVLQHAPFAFSTGRFEVAGRPPARDGELPSAFVTVAASHYLDTFGIALEAGRWLNDRAGEEAPLEAVVNMAAARRFFGGPSAVGQRLRVRGQGWDDRWTEVVGIAGDVRNRGLSAEPQPEILVGIRQAPPRRRSQLYLVLRTDGSSETALASAREVVRQLDGELPVYAVTTVSRLFESGLSGRRMAAWTVSMFGGLGLLLSGLGIYAILAQDVAGRRREIGIRLALGAAPGAVRRLVVRQALGPVAGGTIAGAVVAWSAGRLLSSVMFGLRPDVVSTAVAVAALAAVTLAAVVVPARRAVRVSPSETFRQP